MKNPRTVCVVGLGYIGLPTAVVLAQAGHRVIGVDVAEQRVGLINQGLLPFTEDGLDTALRDVVSSGALTAQSQVPPADVFIIAVPTPLAEGGSADLSYIEDAARSIAPRLKGNGLVILESTSPPGTTTWLAESIVSWRPDLSLDGSQHRPVIHFAHAPERVLPGKIMSELIANDRVIGGLTPEGGVVARDLYSSFCVGQFLMTDAATAEMAKLTENAFRDVNVAFANELSLICAELDIDVWELIELANHHPRVNILSPGPGVGGHCIAVDPWFVISAAPAVSHLLRTARGVNDAKPAFIVDQVKAASSSSQQPVIATLGLAYKADVDDLRESPAVTVVRSLAQELAGARILAVDPHFATLPVELAAFESVELVSLDRALDEAEIIVMLVNHTAFHHVNPEALGERAYVDACGAWRDRRVVRHLHRGDEVGKP